MGNSSLFLSNIQNDINYFIRNSKSVEEVYYSEKELKARRLYHLVVRVNKEEIGDMHSVGLFVNGFDDIKATVSNYSAFENA